MQKNIIIGRPIEDISINGLEYALDENHNILTFVDIEEAKQFLRENVIDDEESLENDFLYIDVTNENSIKLTEI